MADQVDTTPTETTETTETVDPAETPAADAGGAAPEATDAPTDDSEGTVLGGKPAEEGAEGGEGVDDKGAEGAEGESSEDGPPEVYELSLKDADGNDIALDEDAVNEASEVFRELGLTNEQANSIVPLGMKMLAKGQDAAVQQIVEAGAQQKKTWFEEFKSDPEIGGSKREETEQLAAKGLDALGFTEGHPFRSLLNDTGFGNNVHMISAMRKVGELVGEDGSFARSDASVETETVGWSDRYKDE